MSIISDFDDSTGDTEDSFFINDEEATEQDCIQKIAEYTSLNNPFTRVDNDCLYSVRFSDENIPVYEGEEELDTIPYMSYEEITDHLIRKNQ